MAQNDAALIRSLEVEGFCVLRKALSPEQLERLRAETALLPA
eukprot:SAG31_NODE_30648_length_378_cov_0.734767_1_plen_41_part_10